MECDYTTMYVYYCQCILYVRRTFSYPSFPPLSIPTCSLLLSTRLIRIYTARKIPFSATAATQNIMDSVRSKDPSTLIPQPQQQRALTIPRANQPSKYTPEWESYIAANVYMYAVPLAIFIRRAREFDFSSYKFERSIDIVKRVFRVFTPEVIDAIARYLDPMVIQDENDMNNSMYRQVQYHRENLGTFAPPSNPMSLTSLKSDIQSLLEEIDMHHNKKVQELDVFDWFVGKVEGFFGAGVVSGEEKTLDALVERAKVIARLPIDYNMLPRKHNKMPKNSSEESSSSSIIPTRTKDGVLTSYGREQLLSGNIKLNPDNVHFCGDPMRANVTTYEIPILVDLMILLSDEMNQRLGFPIHGEDGKFRINLRFFADYRNSMFVFTIIYIMFKFL